MQQHANQRTVDILCNINEQYTQHCIVMLCSLFENNRHDELTGAAMHFRVHVMHFNLPESAQRAISDFAARYSAETAFYKADTHNIELPNIQNTHISAEAYLRLYIAYYLPENIHRLLYLDVDMIVRGNITQLLDTPLDDVLLAASTDARRKGTDRYTRLRIPEEDGYFNSGMLYINMDYWRKHDITEASLDFIRQHPERICLHDQDVLNVVAHGRWKCVSTKWNMIDLFLLPHPRIEDRYLDDLHTAQKDVRIVHYTGRLKPWMTWTKNPYHNEYYHYLDLTPYCGFRPSLRTRWKAQRFPQNLLNILGIKRIEYAIKRAMKGL